MLSGEIKIAAKFLYPFRKHSKYNVLGYYPFRIGETFKQRSRCYGC